MKKESIDRELTKCKELLKENLRFSELNSILNYRSSLIEEMKKGEE